MRIVCPECADAGADSVVHQYSSETTLMGHLPYYDKDGNRHDHDRNITTEHFSCDKGHLFTRKAKLGTCWCGWKASEET